MTKIPVTVGFATKNFKMIPVRTLLNHFFQPFDTYPMTKYGTKIEFYEIDDIFLVIIDGKPAAFLDKIDAIDYIDMYGVHLREQLDEF